MNNSELCAVVEGLSAKGWTFEMEMVSTSTNPGLGAYDTLMETLFVARAFMPETQYMAGGSFGGNGPTPEAALEEALRAASAFCRDTLAIAQLFLKQ